MISLVLYGRNDNYGYNLHKRAAISFNCMADLLDDPEDEILFVDYNTPDDMPSFVESILDTLTDRARELIRVLRVRPSVHQRWKDKTHLNALEPTARNIAIRRSNPKNRWILSTNTDMVFVMKGKYRSLSQAAKDLPRGYYGIPRFEMPESLWESLDRKDPQTIIRSFAQWGQELHLDEVVHSHKSILYDAPGDFQLVPREDLFKIHGFSEAMLRGWHVDSNLAKRCLLLYGTTKSLFDRVAGYHCDHTKVVTPMHGHDRQQNDMVEHITEVRRPEMPAQAEIWGAPDAAIEDFRLPPGKDISFARAIKPLLGPMPAPVYESDYTEKTWNQVTYPARHVIPYLADQLVTLPRDIDLGYAGMNDTLRALLAETWRALGFTGRMLVAADTAAAKTGCAKPPETDAPYVVADLDYLVEHAALFVLDFGVEDGPEWPDKIFNLERNPRARPLLPIVKATQAAGFKIAASERRRTAERKPARRIILVNTIATELLGQVDSVIGQTITPFCTHIRHGTVKPDPTDAIRQRRAEAERIAESAARNILKSAEGWLPADLLDQVEPHALLTEEQRAIGQAEMAKRNPKDTWYPMALLALAQVTGDFERKLEEFLAVEPTEPQVFLKHLSMVRMAASEAMSRPWPANLAAALDRSCARFLEQAPAMVEDARALGIAGYMNLCRGASGESLDPVVARLVAHAAAEIAGLRTGMPDTGAWMGLDMADFALGRDHGADAAALSERLIAPALRHIAAPRPIATASGARRIALVTTQPYLHAVDPAAALTGEAVRGLLTAGVPAPNLLLVPLAPPDEGFLRLAAERGVAVAAAPEQGGLGAANMARQADALVQAIRGWGATGTLAIGDSVMALALLARGAAPDQSVLGNRLAATGMPGIDLALAAGDLAPWIARQVAAGGASVGVAAR